MQNNTTQNTFSHVTFISDTHTLTQSHTIAQSLFYLTDLTTLNLDRDESLAFTQAIDDSLRIVNNALATGYFIGPDREVLLDTKELLYKSRSNLITKQFTRKER